MEKTVEGGKSVRYGEEDSRQILLWNFVVAFVNFWDHVDARRWLATLTAARQLQKSKSMMSDEVEEKTTAYKHTHNIGVLSLEIHYS